MKAKRLLTIREVEERVSFKHNKIYQMIRAGEFPPGRLIQNKRLWLESDIDAWIDRQWASAS